MAEILNFYTSLFGFVLGFLFDIFNNYGISIVIFTILANILMFPLAIKRQKSLATSLKYEAKKEELKFRCSGNPQRFSEELMLLNQKEGINPAKGCFSLPIISTIILFIGISGSMQRPLTSVLHISQDKVIKIFEKFNYDSNAKASELQILKNFDSFSKSDLSFISDEEYDKISKLSKGFIFLGLNLLNMPKSSKFSDFLWILPLLCLLISIFSVYNTQKLIGEDNSNSPSFGKFGVYLMSFFQAWIVFTVYGAVGLYWIVSSALGILQILFIEKYFSIYAQNAKKEFKLYKEISGDC